MNLKKINEPANSQPSNPNLRLFLDIGTPVKPGIVQTLRWLILNNGQNHLQNVSISIESDHNGFRTNSFSLPDNQWIKPRKTQLCALTVEVDREGIFPFRVFISWKVANTNYSFVSKKQLLLDVFCTRLDIKVQHDCIVKNIGDIDSVSVEMGKEGLIRSVGRRNSTIKSDGTVLIDLNASQDTESDPQRSFDKLAIKKLQEITLIPLTTNHEAFC